MREKTGVVPPEPRGGKGNDDLALGVLRAGFLPPALTAVHRDFQGLGRDAFALLRGRLENDHEPPVPTFAG